MNRSNIYNVIHLAISFLLIFMSFIVAQIFQTSSDHAKHRALAVGILYLAFCLANLSLPSYVIHILGVRLTLFLSSLTYILFIGSNIRYNVWLLYISAFLLGLAAALLWASQGVYVALSIGKHERINNLPSASTNGFINGIFFGIFQSSQIIGNLFVSLLFRLKYPQWIIFSILTTISGIGSFILIFLRPIESPAHPKKRSIIGSLSMLLDIPFLMFVPTMCYHGLVQGFVTSTIPPLIVDKSQKFLIFAFFGFISVCTAVISGKLSDHFGRRLLMLMIGVSAHLIIFGLLLTIWKPPFSSDRWDVFIVMAICFSMGDSILTTQTYAIMSMFYGEKRPTDAFACMKLFQAGSTGIAYVKQIYFPLSIQIYILIFISSISLISLTIENYRIISLDTGKSIKSKQEEKTEKIEIEAEVQLPLTTSNKNISNESEQI